MRWVPCLCLGGQICGLIKAGVWFSLCSNALTRACKQPNLHKHTPHGYSCCQLDDRLYQLQSTYLLFCSAASVASNELYVRIIGCLSAQRPNCIDLFYVFFFDNTKCCDDRPALVGLLTQRQAQTHTHTHTHTFTHSHFSLGGHRTKSLLRPTFEQE